MALSCMKNKVRVMSYYTYKYDKMMRGDIVFVSTEITGRIPKDISEEFITSYTDVIDELVSFDKNKPWYETKEGLNNKEREMVVRTVLLLFDIVISSQSLLESSGSATAIFVKILKRFIKHPTPFYDITVKTKVGNEIMTINGGDALNKMYERLTAFNNNLRGYS